MKTMAFRILRAVFFVFLVLDCLFVVLALLNVALVGESRTITQGPWRMLSSEAAGAVDTALWFVVLDYFVRSEDEPVDGGSQ